MKQNAKSEQNVLDLWISKKHAHIFSNQKTLTEINKCCIFILLLSNRKFLQI